MIGINLRALYWIGKAIDQYIEGPLTPECARVRQIYYQLRAKSARATRLKASAARAKRSYQGPFATPDERYFQAASENASIHGSTCGMGTSWSATKAKGVDRLREPDCKGYVVKAVRPLTQPARRQAVQPTHHVEPDAHSAAQQAYEDELEVDASLARLVGQVRREEPARARRERFQRLV